MHVNKYTLNSIELLFLLRVITFIQRNAVPSMFLYLVDVVHPGTLLRYYLLNDSDMGTTTIIITSITFICTFHIRCISLLYNGYRVFPGGKVRPGRAADHSPPSSTAVMEE